MTRNKVMCEAICHLLNQHGPLMTVDLLPMVFERIPEWCHGDWQRAVEGAQQTSKRQGLITHDCAPGYSRKYIWSIAA